jgi:hypothetical protein
MDAHRWQTQMGLEVYIVLIRGGKTRIPGNHKESNIMRSKLSMLLAVILALGVVAFAQDAASDVGKAAKDTGKATETASKKTAHGTEKAAEKTGHGTKKGVKQVSHGVKKGAQKTEQTVK